MRFTVRCKISQTGKKRKLKKTKDKDAEERLKILIHERDVATRERVNRLDTEQLKSLVDCLMKRQPGFVFDVLDELEKGKIDSFLDMHAVTCSTEKKPRVRI